MNISKPLNTSDEQATHILRRLLFIGAPKCLVQLCYLIMLANVQLEYGSLGCVDYFAGVGRIAQVFRRRGYVAVAYEIQNCPMTMNILTSLGFISAVCLALQAQDAACATGGPVCSSWIWLNRGTSQRSLLNPMGDTTKLSVADGNLMVSRFCLILFILQAASVWWLLEQPKGSLLECHRRMQQILKQFEVFRKHIRMKCFGADTQKDTWLYSPDKEALDELDTLHQPKQECAEKQMVRKYQDSTGAWRICGGADLHASSAYPWGFAEAIASAHERHYPRLATRAAQLNAEVANAELDLDFCRQPLLDEDTWTDAKLEEVVQFLTQAT